MRLSLGEGRTCFAVNTQYLLRLQIRYCLVGLLFALDHIYRSLKDSFRQFLYLFFAYCSFYNPFLFLFIVVAMTAFFFTTIVVVAWFVKSFFITILFLFFLVVFHVMKGA